MLPNLLAFPRTSIAHCMRQYDLWLKHAYNGCPLGAAFTVPTFKRSARRDHARIAPPRQ